MNTVEIKPIRRLIKRKELVSKTLKKIQLLFGNTERPRCNPPEVVSDRRSGIGPKKPFFNQVTADRPASFNSPGTRSVVRIFRIFNRLFKRGLRTIEQRLNSRKRDS